MTAEGSLQHELERERWELRFVCHFGALGFSAAAIASVIRWSVEAVEQALSAHHSKIH